MFCRSHRQRCLYKGLEHSLPHTNSTHSVLRMSCQGSTTQTELVVHEMHKPVSKARLCTKVLHPISMQDIDKTLAGLETSSVVAATIADRPVSHICRLLLGQAAKEHRTPLCTPLPEPHDEPGVCTALCWSDPRIIGLMRQASNWVRRVTCLVQEPGVCTTLRLALRACAASSAFRSCCATSFSRSSRLLCFTMVCTHGQAQVGAAHQSLHSRAASIKAFRRPGEA